MSTQSRRIIKGGTGKVAKGIGIIPGMVLLGNGRKP